MPKKRSYYRKKIILLYGLRVLFRMRSTEEERSMSLDIDKFLHAALDLAYQVRNTIVNPLDAESNKPLLLFLQTWTTFQEEPEYITHKFGYFQGMNHLHGHSGNTERQYKALDTLMNMLDEYKGLLRVPPYHVARLRAAHEYIMASRERKISQKALHMVNAATLFNKLGGHKYQENKRASSLSLFFRSQGAKYEAFAHINMRPIPNLSLCIEKMREASQLAGEAANSAEASRSMRKHRTYCEYWLNIFQMRQSLSQREWDKVRAFHNAAIKEAQFFGSSIFPNYFRSIKDLCNYIYFIRAYEQFCTLAFEESLKCLRDWEEASIILHGESWTFISVKLRRLMLELMIMLKNGDSALSIIDSMREIVKHEFVGRASRLIVALCYQLSLNSDQQFDGIHKQLINIFPHDIYVEQEDEPLNIEEFQLDIKDIVDRLPLPFCQSFSGDELFPESALLDSLLLKYLCVLYEYTTSRGGNKVPKSFWETLDDFIEDFKTTDTTIWTSSLLASLLEYKKIINDDKTGTLAKLRIIKECILSETFAHFPHVVRITRIEDDFVEIKRCWWDYNCDCLRITFHGVHHGLIAGRYYYMPSAWSRKRLHSFDVHHGDSVPLLPAHYYEDNISGIALRYEAFRQFVRLLEEPSAPEVAFRDLIAENPWMIEPGSETSGKEVRAQPTSGSRSGRADLLLKSAKGFYTIVEFKRPTINAEQAFDKAADQCVSYLIDFQRNHPEKNMNPRMMVIAGRNDDLNSKRQFELAYKSPSIELITYDELQKRIENILGFAFERYNY